MANTCIPDLRYKDINAEERSGVTWGGVVPSFYQLEKETGRATFTKTMKANL